MSFLKIDIILGGVISLLVANGHRTFYQFFHWEDVFKPLSIFDRKVFYTLNLFLIPLFLFSAAISFFYTDELVRAEGLARGVLIFHVLFWLSRGIWQIVYFHPSQMGPDQARVLRVHYTVLAASFACFVIYLLPLIARL
ncbi:MAG: hypothetical protein HY073_04565 [Deltaproteobacteria bacterium]|nr:hypothetical protein [Deltaproteobacteria bacterium]